ADRCKLLSARSGRDRGRGRPVRYSRFAGAFDRSEAHQVENLARRAERGRFLQRSGVTSGQHYVCYFDLSTVSVAARDGGCRCWLGGRNIVGSPWRNCAELDALRAASALDQDTGAAGARRIDTASDAPAGPRLWWR